MSCSIELGGDDLTRLQDHARATYPEECCGFLLGRWQNPDDDAHWQTLVERVLAADNQRSDSRHNRFLIPPETVLAAQRQARTAGLEIVGYYHSHPDHPAVPSDFDREHAWPGMSYLIVSVRKGEVAEARSWRLTDDRTRFVEEAVREESRSAAAAAGSPRQETVE